MATKKTTKPKATNATKKSKQPKEKNLSAIDAAAQVLATAKEPMNAKEMIDVEGGMFGFELRPRVGKFPQAFFAVSLLPGLCATQGVDLPLQYSVNTRPNSSMANRPPQITCGL